MEIIEEEFGEDCFGNALDFGETDACCGDEDQEAEGEVVRNVRNSVEEGEQKCEREEGEEQERPQKASSFEGEEEEVREGAGGSKESRV